MDRPKRMANSIIGLNDAIGCFATPMIDAPQPHSKTATSTPKAAPMLRRFMIAALSGTRTERNTAISRMKLRAMTAPKKRGSRDAIFLVTSMLNDALPVVSAVTPVPATAGLMTSLRMWRTHVPVALSWGAVLGTTVMMTAVGSVG